MHGHQAGQYQLISSGRWPLQSRHLSAKNLLILKGKWNIVTHSWPEEIRVSAYWCHFISGKFHSPKMNRKERKKEKKKETTTTTTTTTITTVTQQHEKFLLNNFHLNGHILGFHLVQRNKQYHRKVPLSFELSYFKYMYRVEPPCTEINRKNPPYTRKLELNYKTWILTLRGKHPHHWRQNISEIVETD